MSKAAPARERHKKAPVHQRRTGLSVYPRDGGACALAECERALQCPAEWAKLRLLANVAEKACLSAPDGSLRLPECCGARKRRFDGGSVLQCRMKERSRIIRERPEKRPDKACSAAFSRRSQCAKSHKKPALPSAISERERGFCRIIRRTAHPQRAGTAGDRTSGDPPARGRFPSRAI